MNDTTQPQTAQTPAQAIAPASMVEDPKTARQMAMVGADVSDMFTTLGSFDLASKMAVMLSKCTLLPEIYQGEKGEGNCLMLLDIASRFRNLGISPMTIAQQLVPVNGKYGWQGQFVIAVINMSRRFRDPLKFRFDGEGDDYGCTAYTFGHDGVEVTGTKITRRMVKDEGWLGKNGSKWKTMEMQMFQYRAAAFFGRIWCGDILMGYPTSDELMDIREDRKGTNPSGTSTSGKAANIMAALNAEGGEENVPVKDAAEAATDVTPASEEDLAKAQ